MGRKRKSYPLLNGLRTTAWKLMWRKHENFFYEKRLPGRLQTEPLEIIARKEKLKPMGVTFKQLPVNWDTHIAYLLSKADFVLTFSKFDPFSLYICYWGLGCAFYSKYLSRIDKLFARCRRNRDMKLWQRISSMNTALSDSLPLQRGRIIIFYLMSEQVVLNQFLLKDVFFL